MSKAERYAQHVIDLADQHGVTVVIRGGGIAYRRRREITIPPIKGQVTYLLALHELGHIAIRPEPPLRLAQEAAAWRWALANTIEEPTPATYRSILRCLHGYRQRQQRWASMKESPEVDALIAEIEPVAA
jgi:hypothetical protein